MAWPVESNNIGPNSLPETAILLPGFAGGLVGDDGGRSVLDGVGSSVASPGALEVGAGSSASGAESLPHEVARVRSNAAAHHRVSMRRSLLQDLGGGTAAI
jgi:hypothetical protein